MANIPVYKQAFFEISKEIGEVFSRVKFEGIVGLAFKALSAHKTNPIFDNIIAQNNLKQNIFSFFLSKSQGSVRSQLILGGFDENLIDGEVVYHDLLEEYYWTIELEKILIDGQDSNLCHKCKAIIDTGTSLITGPSKAISQFQELIQIDENCKNKESLPEITFVFHGVGYKIKSEDYIISSEDLGEDSDGKKMCSGLFMPLDVPEPRGPAWILGDLFLMNYVSIFDRDKNRIGFGRAKK